MLHSGMSSDMGLAKLKCVLLLTVSDMIGLELDIVPSRPKMPTTRNKGVLHSLHKFIAGAFYCYLGVFGWIVPFGKSLGNSWSS